MEVLRKLGWKSPNRIDHRPQHEGFKYNTFSITASHGTRMKCGHQELFQAEIPEFAAKSLQSAPSDQTEPQTTHTLSIIAFPFVDTIRKRSILVSRESFQDVYEQLGMHPFALYLVSSGHIGFNYVRSSTGRTTCFVGTSFYTLIWCAGSATPDTASRSTHALILTRGDKNTRPDSMYAELTGMLEDAAAHLGKSSLLAFIVALHTVRWSDRASQDMLPKIRTMEANTHHGRWSQKQAQAHNIDNITEWSREVAGMLVDIASHARHAEIAEALLNYVERDLADRSLASRGSRVDDKEDLLSAARIVKRQVISRKTSLQYFHQRATSQVSVVSNIPPYTHEYHYPALSYVQPLSSSLMSRQLSTLLTHKDAEASIELADAAKRDSSAMKTIAVMTMAFLPGTFFAALFAVPSLNWDTSGAHVIQSQFWVYWAFTLPATMLVFLVWTALNNKTWIWARLKARQKRTKGADIKAMEDASLPPEE